MVSSGSRSSWLFAWFLIGGFQPLEVGTASAVDCVGFDAVRTPTTQELLRFNIKLTFVDASLRPVWSVVLREQGSSVDIGPAAFCRKEGIDYDQDIHLVTCSVTATQMRSVLDSIATIPGLTDGGRDSSACLSVAVIDANGAASRVFDSIIDGATSRLTLLKLRQGLSANDSATAAISALACQLGLLWNPRAVDVTDQVSVTLSDGEYRSGDDRCVIKVRIRNTLADTIAGPAVLALRLYGAAVPLSPTGWMSCGEPLAGAPYYRILTAGDSLAPNGSVEFEMMLSNPKRKRVETMLLRVVRGVGG